MLARLALAAAIVSVSGCGGHAPATKASAAGPATLTPKQIVERSKPAIVRVEAGADKVGTGFVIDGAGVIATNLHVVAAASEINVRLLDGSVLAVEVIVAVDVDHDLALLGVSPRRPLPALALGDSDQVAAGDPVLAIGNPLGVLDYTVSDGLISSVRQVAPGFKLLQISAPISQGSSGGPLFDSFGKVIGVSTAVFTEGQNLNFGMPSNYVAALAAAKERRPIGVAEFGELTRPRDQEIVIDGVRIYRKIPTHPDAIFVGCEPTAVADAFAAIDSAISVGAPLYNRGDHEGCFRIYEAAATKLEAGSTCKGVRDAFGAGLLRASTLTTPAEKAWALRDTFDGLRAAVQQWATTRAP
ncbi:MAG: trypsin-like peptidase domain-containing protein [Myxococcales bacterium]|nr:trypsin-like peptidase domain-containing protein [Myxococcales bacterium]